MRSALYNERAMSWEVFGFVTPDESKILADKVIDMLSHYKGTQDEMGRLKRYLGQEHRYYKAQERDIESMWTMYETKKGKHGTSDQ